MVWMCGCGACDVYEGAEERDATDGRRGDGNTEFMVKREASWLRKYYRGAIDVTAGVAGGRQLRPLAPRRATSLFGTGLGCFGGTITELES